MPTPAAASSRQTTVVVVCVTVLVCFVIGAAAVAFVMVPEGANTVLLISTLVGTLPPTVAALVAVVSIRGVAAGQATIGDDVERLANGLGDAKFRTAVAEVVDPAFHAPGVDAQLEEDKATLERHHERHDQRTGNGGDVTAGD